MVQQSLLTLIILVILRKKRSTIIKIDVDVREGQKKNAGQVRNRLTYIDADSNQIVESYDWVGNKNTDNEKFNDMQYVLDQAVEGLGYGMVEMVTSK